jgi:Protein of unknown function (DUF667)
MADASLLSDEHRQPFSLVSNSKTASCKVTRVGGVSEEMDKSIGRPIIRVKGSVPANNFLQFDGLSLKGPYIYVQLKLIKPSTPATFHIEAAVSSGLSLRLSVSTIYANELPKFLGSSVR